MCMAWLLGIFWSSSGQIDMVALAKRFVFIDIACSSSVANAFTPYFLRGRQIYDCMPRHIERNYTIPKITKKIFNSMAATNWSVYMTKEPAWLRVIKTASDMRSSFAMHWQHNRVYIPKIVFNDVACVQNYKGDRLLFENMCFYYGLRSCSCIYIAIVNIPYGAVVNIKQTLINIILLYTQRYTVRVCVFIV